MMDINLDLLQWFIIFLTKNNLWCCYTCSFRDLSYMSLASQTYYWKWNYVKPANTWKIHSSSTDNIWGADLASIKLISKFNREFVFFIVCYWYFQQICIGCSFKLQKWHYNYWCFLDQPNLKPNITCLDKGSKPYSRLINHGHKIMI